MKKQQVKRIVLSKETLRRLEDEQAQDVKGAFPTTICTGCSASCYNSCPRTCDC